MSRRERQRASDRVVAAKAYGRAIFDGADVVETIAVLMDEARRDSLRLNYGYRQGLREGADAARAESKALTARGPNGSSIAVMDQFAAQLEAMADEHERATKRNG